MPEVQPGGHFAIPPGEDTIIVQVVDHAGPGRFRIVFANGAERITTLNPYQVQRVPLDGNGATLYNIDTTALNVEPA